MERKEKLRLDKYLWAIRLFKTRSLAADACANNKIKQNGIALKAAKTVNIGDEYEIKTDAKRQKIKVTGLLENRVQYKDAVNFYEEITPPEELNKVPYQASAFHTGKRLSKIGRPTKKERRNLNSFLEE